MRQVTFSFWAVGNALFATLVVTLSWSATYATAVLTTIAWPAAILLSAILPIGTVFWPVWLYGEATLSVILVRLAGRKEGRLAHLKWDRNGPTIELETSDARLSRVNRLVHAAVLPGWQGLAAVYLLTVAGGLALSGPNVFGWPLWASIPCAALWAAGWFVYVSRVRVKAN